ncbi:MAG: hypothetical protein IPG74_11795 [Flavobacteriales bacterium]|nr:hypothetical protein [Flavobacteriales bacterium]
MKWKEAPFVRDVYRLLLNRFLEKRDRSYKHELRNRLHPIAPIGTVLSIHAHTETYLRVPLMQAYPGSTCEFFEHGQGDYIHILSGDKPIGDLHALFAKPFRKFLESRGIASGWVLDMVPGQAFYDLAKQQVDSIGSVQQGSSIDRPIVYVILEALDMYNVPVAFWGAYIDRIVELVPDASRFHFVLKPHPRQSPLSLEHTAKRCDALGISYSLLDSGTSTSTAAEVDFSRWADKTEHVFCLVSSACFYLSQLYPNHNIQFHYSTSFMERWISEAPAQYKRLFEHMKPLIKEVFAERCQPY